MKKLYLKKFDVINQNLETVIKKLILLFMQHLLLLQQNIEKPVQQLNQMLLV